MEETRERNIVASLLDLPEFEPERALVRLPRLGLELEVQEIREYQTGSWVFIKAGGRLVDAMEDFQVSFDALSDLAA